MTYSLWECYSAFGYNIISEATSTSTALELVQKELGTRKGYLGLAQAVLQ
jgi:hypothetical protein